MKPWMRLQPTQSAIRGNSAASRSTGIPTPVLSRRSRYDCPGMQELLGGASCFTKEHNSVCQS